ncbi:MAG: hypothetical protein ACQEXX_29720 [Bacillota bacterium]
MNHDLKREETVNERAAGSDEWHFCVSHTRPAAFFQLFIFLKENIFREDNI